MSDFTDEEVTAGAMALYRRVKAETLREAADRLSYAACPEWVVDDLLRWANAAIENGADDE
jgi:hypothetical protein